jgi:hypothetical protein
MKYFSFYLILNIFLCYTGLGASVCYSSNSAVPNMNMKNCHASQPNKISGAKTEANSRVTDTRNHRMSICYEALLNASQSHDFNKTIILYSAAINISNLLVFRISNLHSGFIKEHHPPDLFLSNSSLLL